MIAEHELSPSKVVAIPRGVDLARFDAAAVPPGRVAALEAAWELPPRERATRFLLAGRLTRWKGQMLAIEAAARLKPRGAADFVVVFAGDDQGRTGYRQALEAAVRERGLTGDVRLVGHCDDMPAAYLAADVALAPSLDRK